MLLDAQGASCPLPHNFNSADFYWRLIIFQLIDGESRPQPSISLRCQGNLIASPLELSSMGSLIFPENGPGHQEDTSLNRLNYKHKDTAPSPILEARLAIPGGHFPGHSCFQIRAKWLAPHPGSNKGRTPQSGR